MAKSNITGFYYLRRRGDLTLAIISCGYYLHWLSFLSAGK